MIIYRGQYATSLATRLSTTELLPQTVNYIITYLVWSTLIKCHYPVSKIFIIIIMKSLPNIIPVFPLNGAIYFPKTNLPLNIFEQRYLDLVNDTYKKNKLMGMFNL